MTLKVNEIFYSIQGESSYAGRHCVFVRLTGCNLRCSYCDTQYAYSDGEELEIYQIIDKVAFYKGPLVEITGGEPLIQTETPILIHDLLEKGFKVLLETNGSQDISQLDERCIKIIDIKCPSSGISGNNDLKNLHRLTHRDEMKFVIGNQEDYEHAKEILDFTNANPFRTNPIHFSPVFGKMEPAVLTKWILEDHLEVKLQLQLQKYIWDPEKRGV